MKLPNYKQAIVTQPKITEYLLSLTHRDGKHKALFFTRYGFSVDSWETLAIALQSHAADCEVSRIVESPFGKRYVIEGPLSVPRGKPPRTRSVWFIANGSQNPQFVTAYPLKRRKT